LATLVAFIKSNKIAVGIFGVALAVFLWFAGNFLADFVYFNDPRHKDQALEGWMTPGYVGMSYSLPRRVVIEALELETGQGKRKRIGAIAAERGQTLEELTQSVRDAAEAFRATRK